MDDKSNETNAIPKTNKLPSSQIDGNDLSTVRLEDSSSYFGEISTLGSSKLAILDTECTCDENSVLQPAEIIEIGAVVGVLTLDSYEVVNEFQIYIRPTINSTLTRFCSNLTGITQYRVGENLIRTSLYANAK